MKNSLLIIVALIALGHSSFAVANGCSVYSADFATNKNLRFDEKENIQIRKTLKTSLEIRGYVLVDDIKQANLSADFHFGSHQFASGMGSVTATVTLTDLITKETGTFSSGDVGLFFVKTDSALLKEALSKVPSCR
jgi:hypothetical protein